MRIENTDSRFEREAGKPEKLLLVHFTADWSANCLIMEPIIKRLKNRYGDWVQFKKMDTARESILKEKYRVNSLPTFLFIKAGNLVDLVVGSMPESEFGKRIEIALSNEKIKENCLIPNRVLKDLKC